MGGEEVTEAAILVQAQRRALICVRRHLAVDEQKVSNYAILTTAADKLSAPIHHRMPLIVIPFAYDAWLWPDSDPQDYGAVLENPYADGGFDVYPVSKAANSPKNNSPELLNRVAL